MAVYYRHAQALCGDVKFLSHRRFCRLRYGPRVSNALLGLFLPAADMDHVIEHFRPFQTGLACAKLPDSKPAPFYAVSSAAVLISFAGQTDSDGNKVSALCRVSALCVNDTDVVGVDLRYDHRNIRRVAMGRIAGYDWASELAYFLLQCLNLVFFMLMGTVNTKNQPAPAISFPHLPLHPSRSWI